MYKSILFFVLAFSLSYCAQKPVSSIGITGGLNLPYQKWQYSDPSQKYMDKISERFNIGIGAEFLKTSHLSIIIDLSYNQKGGYDEIPRTTINPGDQSNTIIENGSINVWNHLDYLSFSPQVKTFMQIWSLEPFFKLGASLDLLINKASYNSFTMPPYKNYDISIPYGAGIDFPIRGQLSGLFEFIHQPSIIPVFQNTYVKIKNNEVKFNLGLIWKL